MAIAIVFLAIVALLAAVRISALVGQDGMVHYAVPGYRRASFRRKKFQKAGSHS